MAPSDRPTQPPRAHAVSDLPLQALLTRTDELTRRWAIALILARPMGSLGAVPLQGLADDGPALCGALLEALASDEHLARLLPGDVVVADGPSGRLRALAGAGEDPAPLVEAVEALRGASWELLYEELGGAASPAAARRLAETGDRLAYVCSRLLAEVLRLSPGQAAPAAGAQPTARAPAVEGMSQPLPSGPIAIFDERAFAPGGEEASAAADRDALEPPGRSGPLSERLRAGGAPGAVALDAQEIEIRDERREEGPSAWIGSIGRQLQQFAEDRRPFAVLLVELLDVERSRDGQRDPQALASLLARLERLLADELAAGGGGWLTRERAGRYWLMSPQTDRLGAVRLAGRLHAAVAAGSARLGGSAAVVIGTAVCPEDGERAPSLAAHADVGLYAARAEARAVTGRAAGDESGL